MGKEEEYDFYEDGQIKSLDRNEKAGNWSMITGLVRLTLDEK